MSIQHHPLVTEFPDHRDTIHTLKQENAHFRKLMEEYETKAEIYLIMELVKVRACTSLTIELAALRVCGTGALLGVVVECTCTCITYMYVHV